MIFSKFHQYILATEIALLVVKWADPSSGWAGNYSVNPPALVQIQQQNRIIDKKVRPEWIKNKDSFVESLRDNNSLDMDAIIPPDREEFPDEKLLWEYFDNKKYDRVRNYISRWRKLFPGWSPSLRLMTYLARQDRLTALPQGPVEPILGPKRPLTDQQKEEKRLERKLKQDKLALAFLSEDPTQFIIQSHKNSELFDCRELKNIWAMLPIYSFTHTGEELYDLFQSLLDAKGCKDQETIFYIVQNAQNYLDIEFFNQLFNAALPQVKNKERVAELEKIRYEYHINYLVNLISDKEDHTQINTLITRLEPEIKASKKGPVANAIAWYLLDQKNYELAGKWFEDVQTWSEIHSEIYKDAQYGQAIALHKQGDDDAAFVLAGNNFKINPKLQEIYEDILLVKILSLNEAGKFDEALLLVENNQQLNPKLQGEILLSKAWLEYNGQKFSQSRTLVNKAIPLLDDKRQAEILLAWLDYSEGKYENSLFQFETLYQQQPEHNLVMGIIYSRVALKASRQDLLDLAAANPADFGHEISMVLGRNLYFRKEFLAANNYGKKYTKISESELKLIPNNDLTAAVVVERPDGELLDHTNMAQESSLVVTKLATEPKYQWVSLLNNIDSPSLETEVLYRVKNGQEGSSALRIFESPTLKGTYVYNGVNQFSLYARRFDVESGRPDLWTTEIGSAGILQAGNRSLIHSPDIEVNDAMAFQFAYQRSGWYHPFFSFGLSAFNGEVKPALTFRGGLKKQIDSGYWQIELFSQPVRDSLLSFTGMKDPYSNLEWGRVRKSGPSGNVMYGFNKRWIGVSKLYFAYLTGENVDKNSMVHLSASLGYQIDRDGFDYFKIGPIFSYEHYAEDRNHFTLGHGGYFSPDYFNTIGLGLDFLTDEGKSFILKGHVEVGYQSIENDKTEIFPGQAGFQNQSIRQQDGSSITHFPATSIAGEFFGVDLLGSVLLAPHWQLNNCLSYKKTKGYQEYIIGLGLRYFFRARQASFSTDIPDHIFDVLR